MECCEGQSICCKSSPSEIAPLLCQCVQLCGSDCFLLLAVSSCVGAQTFRLRKTRLDWMRLPRQRNVSQFEIGGRMGEGHLCVDARVQADDGGAATHRVTIDQT